MAATACSSDESASTISGLGFYAGLKAQGACVDELDENGRPVDPNRVYCALLVTT